MGISLQAIEVAIGWEVYSLHRSALDLGWIGLAEFVPLFVLALPAGQLADRVPRRLIFAGALLLAACVSVGLALVSGSETTEVWPYLALAVGAGVAMALGWPAARAMPPTLVSVDLLQNAMTLQSIARGRDGDRSGARWAPVRRLRPDSSTCSRPAHADLLGDRDRHASHPTADLDDDGELPPANVESVLEGLRFVRRTRCCRGDPARLARGFFGGGSRCCRCSLDRYSTTGGPGRESSASAGGRCAARGGVDHPAPIQRRAGRTLLLVVGLYGASIIVSASRACS